jgi:hypothetical protein
MIDGRLELPDVETLFAVITPFGSTMVTPGHQQFVRDVELGLSAA